VHWLPAVQSFPEGHGAALPQWQKPSAPQLLACWPQLMHAEPPAPQLPTVRVSHFMGFLQHPAQVAELQPLPTHTPPLQVLLLEHGG
jgi:hypothetical protein